MIRHDIGTRYSQETTQHTPSYVDSRGYRMEDAALLVDDGDGIVMAVADGHGSTKTAAGRYVGARECADIAISTVSKFSSKEYASTNPEVIFSASHRAMHELDISFAPHVLFERATDTTRARVKYSVNGKIHSCLHGTTLTVVHVGRNGCVVVSHVGDSLAMHIGLDGTTKWLTHAHDVHNVSERERVIKRGAKVSKHGSSMTYSTGGSDVSIRVTRALGHHGDRIISPTPEVKRYSLAPGFIVLASDGVWDHASPEDVTSAVLGTKTISEACDMIFKTVTDKGVVRDNATLLIAPMLPPVSDDRQTDHVPRRTLSDTQPRPNPRNRVKTPRTASVFCCPFFGR